jgi:hypothetical protein
LLHVAARVIRERVVVEREDAPFVARVQGQQSVAREAAERGVRAAERAMQEQQCASAAQTVPVSRRECRSFGAGVVLGSERPHPIGTVLLLPPGGEVLADLAEQWVDELECEHANERVANATEDATNGGLARCGR